jgi:serine/threonine protein phosphatase PrpC
MTSHFQPSSLHQYQRLLSRDIQSGWLDTKTRMLEKWIRYWWVFENRIFRWARTPDEIATTTNCIRFEEILLFKTDTKNKNHMMQIITANSKFFLRADDMEDVINWVWSIQLALTLDLTSVTNRRLNEAHSSATPSDRPSRMRKDGIDTADRTHMASSVHTGNSMLAAARNPIVENGDYYTQLNQIRGYFHDDGEESSTQSRDDTSLPLRRPSTFGEPLSRVPSVSIFRSLPHFPSSDLPENHLGKLKPPIPRSGFASDPVATGKPFARGSPDLPGQGGAYPGSASAPDSIVSPSSSLSRSLAIPIMMGQPEGQSPNDGLKMSGSFREERSQNSPMMSMQYSDPMSPVNPIYSWSPAKPGRSSPAMSPFRSRGGSEDDDGMFLMDEEEGVSAAGPRRGRFESGESNNSALGGRMHWTSGSCNEQGRIKYQEDRCVHYADVLGECERREADGSAGVFGQLPLCPPTVQSSTTSGSSVGYFGVFDGHAGADGSEYVSQNLHLSIIHHELFSTDIDEAIRLSCLAIDTTFLQRCRTVESPLYCGTTAIGAFIRGETLTVFNVGDCRAVLCRDGKAVDMSTPHNPNRAEEAARVLRANGWIDVERVINLLQKRIDMTDPEIQDVVGLRLDEDRSYEVSRVVGDLSVSRSIGDPDYKGFVPGEKVDLCLPWPKDHDQTFLLDLIIAEPEIETMELERDDEFLVLASDGVWDVMTPAQAVNKVR